MNCLKVMDLFPVKSSSISAVGYDKDESKLGVRFPSGDEYEYYRVPLNVYQEMRAAPSVGVYFNEHVKFKYECSGKIGHTRIELPVKDSKLLVATPCYVALLQTKKMMGAKPSTVTYYLWVACGKPPKEPASKNRETFDKCVALVVEAGGGKFGGQYVERAIELAKARRL